MKNYKTSGVILKRVNLKEADKIVTVLTKQFGKMNFIAKGVRKITSRKAPHLEPFCFVNLYLAKGQNLDLITEAEIVDSFNNVRSDLNKIAAGYHICELVDKLTAENQVNRSLFDLLTETFKKLNDKNADTGKLLDDFSLNILWDLGYLPKNEIPHGISLSEFIENVAERKIKSRNLLTSISRLLK